MFSYSLSSIIFIYIFCNVEISILYCCAFYVLNKSFLHQRHKNIPLHFLIVIFLFFILLSLIHL